MQTQAFFDNIKTHLSEKLQQAQNSVFVAVAWFTDRDILHILEQKAQQGVKIVIFLVDDDINTGAWGLDFSTLLEYESEIYWANQVLMHHKFCMIDRRTVISGSYNWTKKASQENRENIIIIEDTDFVRHYLAEIDNLYRFFAQKNTNHHTTSLQKSDTLFFIKQEISFLELEIAKLETETDHTEKRLHQFNIALKTHLWEELKSLQEWKLKIARQKAKTTQKPDDLKNFEEAQRIFQSYEESQKPASHQVNAPKTALDTDLKKLFYKVVKLCHPDLVKPEDKEAAENIFRLAKEASEKDDYDTLLSIYVQLEQGIAFSWNLDELNDQEKLLKIRDKLKLKLQNLSGQLATLQDSDEWQIIQQYNDWLVYFAELKSHILDQIAECKKIFKNLSL